LACPAGSYCLSVVFQTQNSLKISNVHIHSGAGKAYGDWFLAGRSQVRISVLIPSILHWSMWRIWLRRRGVYGLDGETGGKETTGEA